MAKRKSAGTSAVATAPAPQAKLVLQPKQVLPVAVIALVLLVLVVYFPVRHFPFVNWDDADYVSGNAHVLAGLTAETVRWAATANTSGNWHPVTMLSHALVVELAGQGPGAQHVANLLLHTANTLLLFGLLAGVTGSWGRSFFVAAMFAVHPIHVESVAWISERKDVLSTFFWLLSLWMYLRYVRQPRLAPYLLLLLFFALALMSKAMVVTLPFALLLIDIWPLRRARSSGAGLKKLILEKLPLFALALIAGVVTLIFQSRVGAVSNLESLDVTARLAGAVDAYVSYLGQTIWPAALSPFYPPQVIPLWLTLVEAGGLAMVTAAVVRARARWPFLLVGWFWFLIILLPTIGIVKAGEQARADRYMYLPLVGVLVILAWGVPELLKRWQRHTLVLPALVAAVLIATVPASRAQVSHWSDSAALWRHAVSVTTDNRRAYENLGQALRERGELPEAYATYERALALSAPSYKPVMHNAMGLVAIQRAQVKEAIAHFEAAVGINPSFAEARTNLGNALSADRRPSEALGHYRTAVELTPDSAEGQLGMAGALLTLGEHAEARFRYQETIRLDPRMAEAHAGLGTALAQAGDLDRAIQALTQALRLNPNLVTANLNLGLILAQQGDRARAISHLETALRLAPSLSVARDALKTLR